MSQVNDNSLVAFKAITNFVLSLEEVFGRKFRSLKLYARLLQKTTLTHTSVIEKHIQAFYLFLKQNSAALKEQDKSVLHTDVISYSERVYINIKLILNEADGETSMIIWKHLLTIAAIIDPSSKARSILAANNDKIKDNTTEKNFISDIIDQVETHMSPGADPLEAVSSIMKSDLFSNLVENMGKGIEDGNLNLGKLMGSVQEMVSEVQGDDQTQNLPSLGPGLDMGSLMKNMVSGLSGMNMDTNTKDDDTEL